MYWFLVNRMLWRLGSWPTTYWQLQKEIWTRGPLNILYSMTSIPTLYVQWVASRVNFSTTLFSKKKKQREPAHIYHVPVLEKHSCPICQLFSVSCTSQCIVLLLSSCLWLFFALHQFTLILYQLDCFQKAYLFRVQCMLHLWPAPLTPLQTLKIVLIKSLSTSKGWLLQRTERW